MADVIQCVCCKRRVRKDVGLPLCKKHLNLFHGLSSVYVCLMAVKVMTDLAGDESFPLRHFVRAILEPTITATPAGTKRGEPWDSLDRITLIEPPYAD